MKTPIRPFRVINAAVVLVALSYGLAAEARYRTSITFDPEGSTGTNVVAINQAGVIAGNFTDTASQQHGFVRQSDGAITTFDPPGGSDTSVLAMNSAGAIVGTYSDSNGNSQLFLRAVTGTFATIELPLGLGFMLGAVINARGEIAGNYFDNTFFGLDSFLRTADGTVTTFTAPEGFSFVTISQLNDSGTVIGGACTYVNNAQTCSGFLQTASGTETVFDPPDSTYTTPVAINSGGAIAGIYTANNTSHGFLRTANGAIRTFDVLGSTGTFAGVINSGATIAGIYNDSISEPHGFVRTHQGAIITFDFPPAVPNTQGRNAGVVGINPEGAIAGNYFDNTFVPPNNFGTVAHGFERARDGTFTTVDPLGSTHSTVVGITPKGVVAGSYADSNSMMHGFVFRGDDN
jgi:hypothetical protein